MANSPSTWIEEWYTQTSLEDGDLVISSDGADGTIDTSQAPTDLVVDCGTGKTLELTTSVWDDLRVPVTSTKRGGTKDPDFAVWLTNGSGSQGVFVDWFDKSAEEELYFTAQFPHQRKNLTDIEPHVHWVPNAAGAEGKVVRWGLEYVWFHIGGVATATAIIYGEGTSSVDTALKADKHYITDLTTIAGASVPGVSSMLIGRVFRDATSEDDDYDDDAGLLEVDFHYEIDTMGSRTVGSK